MTPEEFAAQFANQINAIEKYISDEFPRDAGYKILRFIDGNFRASGYQGATFEPWKPNKTKTPILKGKTGNLRRGFHQTYSPVEVRTFTNVPYAGVHNNGFSGTVNVKAYTYNKYTEAKLGTGRFNKNGTERTKTVHVKTGEQKVGAHTRNMNMPKRQFMPTSIADSPVLYNSIKKMTVQKLMEIFPQSLKL